MPKNNILIVGNGYDISFGLKTRFSDFFTSILQQYITFSYKTNYVIDKPVDDYLKNIPNKYKGLKSTYIQIKDKESFFKNQFISILIYYFYFDVYVYKRINDIQEILKTIRDDNSLKNMMIRTDNAGREGKERYTKFLNLLSCLKNQQNDIKWMDVEGVIKDLVSENIHIPTENYELAKLITEIEEAKDFYNKEDIFKKIDYDFSKISYKECKKGLDLFNKLFCEYLSSIYKDDIKTPKDFLLSQEYTHAISLNYTPTFKNSMISQDDEHICYIHGDFNHNIVVGTESFYFNADTRNENNYEKTPFFKFFQKIFYKTDTKYLQWITGTNNTFDLTFFGFSFSQNDYDLIRELIVDDEKNEDCKTNLGTIRNGLENITIYCLKEEDKYSCFMNLSTCLGKKHLTAIKDKLNFKIIEELIVEKMIKENVINQ